MTPILYSFRRCPYAIRARMALHYSGVICELREVVLKNKPAEMLQASPKATVPVLVIQQAHEQLVIDESIDVMQWALSHGDKYQWLAHSLDHELIQINDGHFKYNLDRYKYFERFPEEPRERYFERACEFLADLDGSLIEDENGNVFLLSKKISALDVAIFPFVRQFAFADKQAFDLLPYKQLKRWLAYFLDSPLFLNVMSKYQPWSSGQSEKGLFGNV